MVLDGNVSFYPVIVPKSAETHASRAKNALFIYLFNYTHGFNPHI